MMDESVYVNGMRLSQAEVEGLQRHPEEFGRSGEWITSTSGGPPKVAKSSAMPPRLKKALRLLLRVDLWTLLALLAIGFAAWVQVACLLSDCYVAPESEYMVVPVESVK